MSQNTRNTRKRLKDFPGGPVARHFHFGGPGSIFGLRSEISKVSGTWVKKDFNVFF